MISKYYSEVKNIYKDDTESIQYVTDFLDECEKRGCRIMTIAGDIHVQIPGVKDTSIRVVEWPALRIVYYALQRDLLTSNTPIWEIKNKADKSGLNLLFENLEYDLKLAKEYQTELKLKEMENDFE